MLDLPEASEGEGMKSRRKETLEGQSLDYVADIMSGSRQGDGNDQMARAEFLLRQTKYQEEQTKHQEDATNTAKKHTRYMFWSVVILALSAVGTFVIALIECSTR